MKFLLIVHHHEAGFAELPETTRKAMLDASIGLTHELNAAGQYLSAAPLHPTVEGARVRVRNGKPMITDGPFVETHEQIAGYFLVNAASREAAIAIATRIPGARTGTVEVRQILDVDGLPEARLSN